MEVTVTPTPAETQRTGCLVLGVFEGRRLTPSAQAVDDASSGLLARLLRASALKGRPGQTLTLHHLPGAATERAVLVGCGKRGKLGAEDYRAAVRGGLAAAGATGATSAAVYLTELEVDTRDDAWKLHVGAELAHDGAYRFEAHLSETTSPGERGLAKVAFAVAGRAAAKAGREAVERGSAVGRGTALARDLGNQPANVCTPSYLADQARRLARRHASLKVSVRGEAEMKRLGMGALLAVAAGSAEPPRLVVLEYKGAPESVRPIVLVGKGVTFDSGGISIKPGAGMDEMKFDMCGAASVLGALSAVAELGLACNVVGIVAATENLPSGTAVKPGDIVKAMSGRTVEILNTDAEGRLILCDALTFARRYEPDVIIDIATLTGACVVALGAHASGLFSNDDALADALLEAGDSAGDRAWRMPLWSDYAEQLKSNFADLANIGGREAGAVTAACFLGKFAEDLRWAHLDIAGTAWRTGKAKGATGRPVPLLCRYLIERSARRARTPRKRASR